MRIIGIALVWVGVVSLLKNIGIIEVINWSIVWPVLVIILGFSLRHCKSMMHGITCKGANCDMCVGGKCGGEGVCEGPNCKH